MPTTKSIPFVVSKDEWDTKEGPGKSMKNSKVCYSLKRRPIYFFVVVAVVQSQLRLW